MDNPILAAVNRAKGKSLQPATRSYDERDVSLYALGIGAASDPLDERELRYVYERHPAFAPLPTFALTLAGDLLQKLLREDIVGIAFDPAMLVHGEQRLEILAPLPPQATVTTRLRIADIFDKGSGMLLNIDAETESENGVALASMRWTLFIRGIGGFGGERGKSATIAMPDAAPDFVSEERTRADQALLYRLSGDLNPLHIDPAVAQRVGYPRPILHGLCSFGFATRALLRLCRDMDAEKLKSIGARFAAPVYPGETLRTEIWRLPGGDLRFRVLASERNEVALSQGWARLAD